ncbi:MAG: trigger factor [Myxococcales bacterium]|nr:trigger factor [Myxococcales bacterium]
MLVRIEEQSPIARRVVITVPAPLVSREFSGAYNRLSQKVSLPGFRRGKIPAEVLRKRYGSQIALEVAQSLVDEGWQTVMRDHGVLPVSQPRFEGQLGPATPDSEYTFSFTVEVPPEFDLGTYYGLPIERTDWQIPGGHIEHELTHVADSASTWEPVGDRETAAQGDMVIIDFKGKRDGVPFEGGEAQDYELELGSGRMIPGFEAAVLGQKVSEPFTFDLTFPESYPHAALAGASVTFDATIKDLKTKVVPPIDDELAGTLGMADLEALKAEVRKRMLAHWDGQSRTEVHNALREALANSYSFDLPPSLLEAELAERRKSLESELPQETADRDEKLEDGLKIARGDAEKALRVNFVLDAIAAKESLDVEESEVNRQIEAIVRSSGSYAARMRQMYKDEGRKSALRRRLRHDKVLDFLLLKANVTLIPKDIPAHNHDGDHGHGET